MPRLPSALKHPVVSCRRLGCKWRPYAGFESGEATCCSSREKKSHAPEQSPRQEHAVALQYACVTQFCLLFSPVSLNAGLCYLSQYAIVMFGRALLHKAPGRSRPSDWCIPCNCGLNLEAQ
ncbi:hypothetical protein M431DRAFT_235411 [Trichoderma harzianum CBS 226.95]|uniref:Uncharacterized protein n=1 Tax=Trichoderma harzianum CBS 226.95 TaxID=983964 RepID=A0A2T4A244_TRIHA|nr:hypothetical protein M431DRAFT_235411 [Trichoderma harzianum CBS 226.95]PTB51130.1 hypothetical protein M431DRAFT_235411 [Trichoderma harzianum CBS 226.95]